LGAPGRSVAEIVEGKVLESISRNLLQQIYFLRLEVGSKRQNRCIELSGSVLGAMKMGLFFTSQEVSNALDRVQFIAIYSGVPIHSLCPWLQIENFFVFQ